MRIALYEAKNKLSGLLDEHHLLPAQHRLRTWTPRAVGSGDAHLFLCAGQCERAVVKSYFFHGARFLEVCVPLFSGNFNAKPTDFN